MGFIINYPVGLKWLGASFRTGQCFSDLENKTLLKSGNTSRGSLAMTLPHYSSMNPSSALASHC